MSMGYFFPVYLTADDVCVKAFFLGTRYFSGHLKKITEMGRRLPAGRQVPYPPVMFFRDYLRMPRSDRVDIQKCQEIIVLVNHSSGNFFFHNFTEYAFIHSFAL